MSSANLRRLHRGVVEGDRQVRDLLERAMHARCTLYNGVDRKSVPRTARISEVSASRLLLRAPNIRAGAQPQVYLHFDLGASRFFFASPPLGGGGDEPLALCLPEAIYAAERRDLNRVVIPTDVVSPRVRLAPRCSDSGKPYDGKIFDVSYQGLGVVVSTATEAQIPHEVVVEFVDGERAGEKVFGAVRHRRPDPTRPGSEILGLEVSSVEPAPPFPVEARERILEGGLGQRTWRRVALAGKIARTLPKRSLRSERSVKREQRDLEVAKFPNTRGEEIVGLLDRGCGGTGGTAVVIPPAWGRTKETFLPLARCIVAAFEAIGEPVTVLRFDGTNRRGESFVDPECRTPGDEYLHFSFSQAIRDIEASFEFLESREDIAPERTVLVSFSLGSVEARRVVMRDQGRRLSGWISVVGMVDLQSGLRTVSGGVDFAFGQSMGIEFGRHELVGVISDMDYTGRDAFEHDLVFHEDAKRDMARIGAPVTWLHGRDDAWMDLERVRSLMAAGRIDNRRLIELPTGHQMRNSREALETFQFVAIEVVRMALGKQTDPVLPDLNALDLRTRAERSRRPPPTIDVPSFWEDYLLGRDRKLGFELLSATSAYRQLMRAQIEQLAIESGHTIFDLGAGNGDFALQLAKRPVPRNLRIVQLDLVPHALARSRERFDMLDQPAPFHVDRLAANLELAGCTIPLAAGKADSILASLLLSYVESPHELLTAMYDLLKPGGRLVLSSMKRDADISGIYVDSMAELPPDRRIAHFGVDSDEFDEIQRVFLNDAARLIQLEEVGRFHFWDVEELIEMCMTAGFELIGHQPAFGTPPQAVIVAARRPAG